MKLYQDLRFNRKKSTKLTSCRQNISACGQNGMGLLVAGLINISTCLWTILKTAFKLNSSINNHTSFYQFNSIWTRKSRSVAPFFLTPDKESCWIPSALVWIIGISIKKIAFGLFWFISIEILEVIHDLLLDIKIEVSICLWT